MIGKTLLHYHITAKLGEGGMGEVYRARDTKLGRDVAIKILPAAMAENSARLERFRREARAVAALDHPSIVTVYAIETVEAVTFMAMQLVEGPTLDAVIDAGGLPLERMLSIAVPLADALGAAHDAGVTHRDLKPGNIVVGDSGRVHVLDFGLAKREIDDADEDGETRPVAKHLTTEGQIVGTVAYMSPEQAQGKAIDSRSDIFSFGVVLYQMATGDLPFRGENQISVITAILRDQPELVTRINRRLPWHLSRIVRRCLQKDPDKRYQSAKDLRLDLETLQHELESGEGSLEDPVGVAAGASSSSAARAGGASVSLAHHPRAWAVGAMLLVVGLGGGWWIGQGKSPTPAPPTTKTLAPAIHLVPLALEAGDQLWPSLTPDGQWFVYQAQDGGDFDIFLRAVGGQNPINLTQSSTADDQRPVVSPDGATIVFQSDRQGGGLFTMGRTGESVRRVADRVFDPSWSPDGARLVVATEPVDNPYSRSVFSDLRILDLASGNARGFVTTQDAVEPDWSPHGQRIAFWGLREGSGQRDIWTASVDDGSLQEVTSDAATDWNPTWSPDGRYLYFSSDRGGGLNLWRVPIDEATGIVEGSPEPVTLAGSTAAIQPSFARESGRMAYVERRSTSNLYRIPFDPVRMETTGPPEALTRGARTTAQPSPSPDGQWLAFIAGPPEDIYVMRMDGSEVTQLTNDAAKDRRPLWSPDGAWITFYSDRDGNYGAWLVQPDGRGLHRLYPRGDDSMVYASWHPDGTRLLTEVLSVGNSNATAAYEVPFSPTAVDVDEAAIVKLWDSRDMGGRLAPSEWHQDGRRIAALFQSEGNKGVAAVYDTQTHELTRYDDIGEIDGVPQWIPGTDALLVDHDDALGILDTTTGTYRQIIDFSPLWPRDFFSVARDGTWIYVCLSSEDPDIWMLEVES